ncbi:peroxide stress protein YaaA [Ruegeria jejuensis]|uniref:peroxide stress protein YaaA n=1 Tax=Ruegeria jejuensis TaxID=3233338 RepID=UPI00355C8B48
MLVVISPAKRLDWAERDVAPTQPDFQDDAIRLARTARNLTLGDLRKLMGLSDDLARLNRDRFRSFAEDPAADAVRPAALAFAGDTYQGLEAASLDSDEMRWAQDHLRILSGLYGVLRPLDAIQPYRLEMGSRLKTRRGKSLYDYWRDQLSKALNAQAAEIGSDTLINCASQEYFGAVAPAALKLRVITPVFMEDKAGSPKIVSFFAKKARGAMARYIIRNRLTDPAGLLEFDTGGYVYQPEMSDPDRPVFLRPYAVSTQASPAQTVNA